MAKEKPGIYIFHGEDEYSISQAMAELEARLGDPTTVALNKVVLEARDFNMDELRRVASAMPFLAERRVVVVKNAIQRISTAPQQEKLLSLLVDLPLSTAVFFVEDRVLKDNHWLLDWAKAHKGRVYVRGFSHEKIQDLPPWIHAQAKRLGGKFTPEAAATLAMIVGNNTYLLHQEIVKLLDYVNLSRPVDEMDVNTVTVGPLMSNVFIMVDALSVGDGKQALGELRRLFEMEDALQIFGMIVRQFRLLLLTAEVLQESGRLEDVARQLGIRDFIARKLIPSAQRIGSAQLEAAYHRLLELDWEIKTGQIEDEAGMDLFVADFTTR